MILCFQLSAYFMFYCWPPIVLINFDILLLPLSTLVYHLYSLPNVVYVHLSKYDHLPALNFQIIPCPIHLTFLYYKTY